MPQSLSGHLRDQLRLAWLALAALTLLSGALQAQQPATLTGRVTSESGQPLGSAEVTIEQLSAGAVSRPGAALSSRFARTRSR